MSRNTLVLAAVFVAACAGTVLLAEAARPKLNGTSYGRTTTTSVTTEAHELPGQQTVIRSALGVEESLTLDAEEELSTTDARASTTEQTIRIFTRAEERDNSSTTRDPAFPPRPSYRDIGEDWKRYSKDPFYQNVPWPAALGLTYTVSFTSSHQFKNGVSLSKAKDSEVVVTTPSANNSLTVE